MTLPVSFLKRPIAHRALHGPGRVENSRAAIDAAIAAEYGIEIDLQLSSDGQAMVFHDYTLDRLTEESGPVRQRSSQDLCAIPLRGMDEGIPTLVDVLALVEGRVPLLIELKDQDGIMGPNVGELEEATAAALSSYAGPVAVMSFNPYSVAKMAQLAPDLPRGLTTCAWEADDNPTIPAARREELSHLRPQIEVSQAQFISHDYNDLHSPQVADIKSQGYPVLTWVVRNADEEAKARKIADNITFEDYTA